MKLLPKIQRLPARLETAFSVLPADCSTNQTAPPAPTKTPAVFNQVMGSRRKTAAKSMTIIGVPVVMTEASIGEVMLSPQIKSD